MSLNAERREKLRELRRLTYQANIEQLGWAIIAINQMYISILSEHRYELDCATTAGRELGDSGSQPASWGPESSPWSFC